MLSLWRSYIWYLLVSWHNTSIMSPEVFGGLDVYNINTWVNKLLNSAYVCLNSGVFILTVFFL